MKVLSRSERQRHLLGAAKSYQLLNYSVIPVHGNADKNRSKVAAVSWKLYQRRPASLNEIKTWFTQHQFQGLAIVTGRVSGLVVLDFDDADLAREFANRYPELTRTRTVQTANRQLPHYYYHLPAHLYLGTRRAAGVDLQADGCYVIAPPTVIGEAAYRIVRGGQPQTLTNAKIQQINVFFEALGSTPHQDGMEGGKSPFSPVMIQVNRPVLSLEDAVNLYQLQAVQLGRNNALFKIVLRLRDSGWTQQEVLNHFVSLHVQQTARTGGPQFESPQQRHAEARATIASAYTHPPRRQVKLQQTQKLSLPNRVREFWLQAKQTYLVRVLDGLLLNGIQPNQFLTEKHIGQILKDQVGRHSILKALSATYPDGTPIFTAASESDPSPRPPSHTDVATANAEDSNNQCLLFGVTKSNKNLRGRPPKSYKVPDIELICAQLGLEQTAGDPLNLDDVSSVRKYREAMQRELIKRRPGQYTRKWLAQRLGISIRTLQRYRNDVCLKQRPIYDKKAISWDNLNHVPEENEIAGVFLQDETGKRYPAIRTLTKVLLNRKKQIYLMRQRANYYWHTTTHPLALMSHYDVSKTPENAENRPSHVNLVSSAGEREKTAETTQFYAQRTHTTNEQSAGQRICSESNGTHQAAFQIDKSVIYKRLALQQARTKPKRYYRQPLPDEIKENTARLLYRKIKRRCQEKVGYMSKATARRLTEQYGVHQVQKVIQILTWRDHIENPAGFVVVWLRSQLKRHEVEALVGRVK